MANDLQPPRGTHDLIGEDQRRHTHVVDTARRIAATYGFDEWSTPIFEDTRVFSRTLGETSDVVTKEMYTFDDRGGDPITLRPEATAGVCRALVTNGLTQSLPQKVFYDRPDVPLRAPAEGPLPAVPPDRHRADRPGRTARRRRGDRLRLGHPAGARRRRRDGAGNQHAGRQGKPRRLSRRAGRPISPQHQARAVAGQPGAAGPQPAAHPGQQGRGRPAHRRRRADDRAATSPRRRRRSTPACAPGWTASACRTGRTRASCAASTITATPRSSSSPPSWARRAR